MKIDRLAGLILTTVTALSLQRAVGQPLDLSLYTTSGAGFYTNTFDTLGYGTNQTLDGTPTGAPGYLAGEWTCYTHATVNFFGTIDAGAPNVSGPGIIDTWTDSFIGEFKNFASYFDYIGGTNFYPSGVLTNLSYGVITNGLYQTNEPNRCLGIRQTGAFGDPGAAFTLKLANTAPYENFKMSIDLINLDPSSPRQTIWHVQYGVADPTIGVPAAFQDLPGNSFFNPYVDTPGKFHWQTLKFNIPNGAINNINGQVWLRVAALATSTTSGNRESFAIDNFGLTWTTGDAGCTPATNAITITPPSPPVYANATVQFSVNEAATQPIYYQWLYNGQDVSQVFPSQVVGYSYRSSTLTLQNVTTANNGLYSCIISNVCGSVYAQTSAPVALAVTNVPVVSLGYLRTLTDPSNSYAVTVPQSQLWQVTGMITTVTNTTSGNTASYYIQDASGGMNLFVTGGANFRPQIGDDVTAIGYLNSFQGNLELEADLTGNGNNATSVMDLSNNIAAYPAAKLLDWPAEFAVGVTNNTVEQGATNSSGILTGLGSKKGSVCLLTNVYFGTNAGITINGNYYVSVTNASGLTGYLLFWGAFNPDLNGRVLPSFASSVKGVLFANEVTGGGSFWSGLGVSAWTDVNPLDLISIVYSPTNGATLSWNNVPISVPAAPYTPYSLWYSTNLAGTNWTVIATGLTNISLSYTDADTNSPQKFYRLTSP